MTRMTVIASKLKVGDRIVFSGRVVLALAKTPTGGVGLLAGRGSKEFVHQWGPNTPVIIDRP